MNIKKITTLALMFALLIITDAVWAQGYSAGIRYWQANFEAGPNDFGDAPFFIGYLGLHDAHYHLVGQFGYGSGWETEGGDDIERMDLSVALTRSDNIFTYGLGIRRVGYDVSELDEELDYTGPEVLAGISVPIQETGLTLGLSGSFGVYWWEVEQGDASDDGVTTGFSADGGVSYTIDTVVIRGGYRYQQIQEDEPIYEEEFRGAYVELALSF